MQNATPLSLISARDLHALLDRQDVVVLDVREPEEHADWSIPGSINIPLDKLIEGAKPPAAKRVIVYCARGARSATAQHFLAERGISSEGLAGGMMAWNGVYDHASLDAGSGGKVVQIHRVGKGCLSYLAVKDGDAIVIDPTLDTAEYVAAASALGARIVATVDTHAHADHASGARALATELSAPYFAPAEVGPHVQHDLLAEGTRIPVGSGFVEALATPGHTPGSMTLLFEGVAFTADALFVDGVGRPDLGQEAAQNARVLHRTLHERILHLPPATTLLPGHRGAASSPRGEPVRARLGDLPARIAALGMTEDAFAAWVEASHAPKPENFQTIRRINLGLETIDSIEDIRELEAGPNRCGVSS